MFRNWCWNIGGIEYLNKVVGCRCSVLNLGEFVGLFGVIFGWSFLIDMFAIEGLWEIFVRNFGWIGDVAVDIFILCIFIKFKNFFRDITNNNKKKIFLSI